MFDSSTLNYSQFKNKFDQSETIDKWVENSNQLKNSHIKLKKLSLKQNMLNPNKLTMNQNMKLSSQLTQSIYSNQSS